MTIHAVFVVFIVLAGCSREGGDERRERCAELREHMADLTVARAGAKLSAEEQAKHHATLVASSGDAFVKKCVEEMSDKELECGLAAASVDDATRCRRSR